MNNSKLIIAIAVIVNSQTIGCKKPDHASSETNSNSNDSSNVSASIREDAVVKAANSPSFELAAEAEARKVVEVVLLADPQGSSEIADSRKLRDTETSSSLQKSNLGARSIAISTTGPLARNETQNLRSETEVLNLETARTAILSMLKESTDTVRSVIPLLSQEPLERDQGTTFVFGNAIRINLISKKWEITGIFKPGFPPIMHRGEFRRGRDGSWKAEESSQFQYEFRNIPLR